MTSRQLCKTWSRLLDCAMLILAWSYVVLAIWRSIKFGSPGWLDMGIGFGPVLSVIWLQVRIAPRIYALSERQRREELAVTWLAANEYLAARLKRHYFWALLPLFTAWPVLIAAGLALRPTQQTEEWWHILTWTAAMTLGTIMSVTSTFVLLTRYCRGQICHWLRTVAIWSVGSVAAPCSIIYGPETVYST